MVCKTMWQGSTPCGTSMEGIMALMIEIRAAEGGDDAKDLVDEQFGIYARVAARRGL